jgi:hypothetical protein
MATMGGHNGPTQRVRFRSIGVILSPGQMRSGVAVWQLCGTAKSQLDSIGPLLLGWKGWHVAWRQSEWTGGVW